MKRGYLERNKDISGVTGTGEVAEFVIASDGRVSIFWPVGVGVWPSLEAMMAVHGHEGATIAVLIDDPMLEEHCLQCHSPNGMFKCPKHLACPVCIEESSG